MSIRCILFWVDSILSNYSDSDLFEDLSIKSLDSYVEDGCVGQLLSINQPNATSLNLNQLLGFETDTLTNNKSFKEKYSDLSLRLITTSSSLSQECNNKEFNTTLISSLNSESIVKQINITMSEKVELVIVHLEPVTKSLEDRRSLLTTLDQIVKSLKELPTEKPQPELYINIVVSFDDSNVIVPLTEQQKSSLESIPSWFNPPIQSTQFYDGKPIEPRQTSPMFAIYSHPSWTRKDETKSFKLTEFIKGSNGKILMIQYLKELAFKLGKIPKYGA